MNSFKYISFSIAALLITACSQQTKIPNEAASAKPQPENTTPVKSNKKIAILSEQSEFLLEQPKHYQAEIKKLCDEIGNKLTSVSREDCHNTKMQSSGIITVQKRSVAIKEFPANPSRDGLGRVLVIGGIHGDEYASTSIAFKWMQQLQKERDGRLHWRFIPALNADGLLRKKSQRQNANGVDLNRNFPSADWNRLALDYWTRKDYKNPRRYPGKISASEPETQGLIAQINNFKPDIIVSIHAPYHLLDYDGPSTAPQRIGDLHLHELGVYPGSLGNYAGLDLKLPVVTLELPSAGILPKPIEIQHMWTDLNKWLINERLVNAKKEKVNAAK